MNRINFLQTGGFPTDLNTYDFMQAAYTQLQKLAYSLAGDKPCIVSGCVVGGGSVTEGYVIIAGELLKFETQPLGTYVTIEETVTPVTFEDGDSKDSFYDRKAVFGLSGTPWADFVRIPVIAQSESKLRKSLENLLTFLKVSSPTKLDGLVFDVDTDDYTHTAGIIAYNNTLYTVDELVVPFTNPVPGDKPKFAIDTDNAYEHKMVLVASNDSDGLFEYDTLLPVHPTYNGFTFSTGWADGAGSGTFATLSKISNTVELTINLSITTGGTATVTTLPTDIRPKSTKRVIIADYNGSDLATVLLLLEIAPSGVLTIRNQSNGAKPVNRDGLIATIIYTLN